MTFALWTILAAAALPYFSVGLAKFGGRGYDNSSPRQSLAQLQGWRARAEYAHRNHFEAFPPFAAAVLTATVVHAPQGRIDVWAAAFIAVRVLYTAAYILNLAAIRSLLWALGIACVIGLFCAGLR